MSIKKLSFIGIFSMYALRGGATTSLFLPEQTKIGIPSNGQSNYVIDLRKLQIEAKKAFKEIDPNDPSFDVEIEGAWFADGVSNLDSQIVYDHSQVVVLGKGLYFSKIDKDLRLAYSVGLNGKNEIFLVRVIKNQENKIVKFLHYKAGSFMFILNREFFGDDRIKLMDDLRKKIPEITQLSVLKRDPILTVTTSSVPASFRFFNELNKMNLIEVAELNAENYLVPYMFDEPILLNLGLDSIDLEALRTFSAEARRRGQFFQHEINRKVPKPADQCEERLSINKD